MVAKVSTCGVNGIKGIPVVCECDLSGGLPKFDIVGLPDTAVKEARGRVQAAIKNSGYSFPLKHITVNLAPAEMKKEGTIYDLPILVGILSCAGIFPAPDPAFGFVGELSLEGSLRPASGILPMVVAARKNGMKAMFVPKDNGREAAAVGGIDIYPVGSITELAAHLKGETHIEPLASSEFEPEFQEALDYADVVGQETVKRALTVAAAGSHNILLIGTPGSGKSMMARRLPSILPDITEEEALETTMIYSVAGMLTPEQPIVRTRPFRAPHHTISTVGLAGGGANPRPGEISLAHNGVLFLDEFPEFKSDALEIMRQPMEDGRITISRASGTASFPARFMLVCAMNPCKCGYYGHPSNRCTCTDQSVRSYMKRISGPLLDRIDLHISVPPVDYMSLKERRKGMSSAEMRETVKKARRVQEERFGKSGIYFNSQIPSGKMKELCPTDAAAAAILKAAFEKLGLSARSYDRLLKVSRTIADIDGAEIIGAEHVAEAIQYRSLDRDLLY